MLLDALSEKFQLYPPNLGEEPLKQDHVVETTVDGFRAGAVACGLRSDGREDLALIAADETVNAGAVYTKNKLAAAPVQLSRRNAVAGRVRAVMANSGNANAATGSAGLAVCQKTLDAAAHTLQCQPSEMQVCSTGVIGKLLDGEKIIKALPGLMADLSPDGLKRAAHAIRTTDVNTKMAEASTTIHGKEVKVVGFCKGAGMIRPDMATMLAFVLTDAAAESAALQSVVKMAAGVSFNRITVDGDTSTNDTLLLLASGKAGNKELTLSDPQLVSLAEAVVKVCQRLAAMIAADGEGAGHLVLIRVAGASSRAAARDFCYAISHSPLCKTALASGDPYWGRFLSAVAAEAGRQGLPFSADRASVAIGDTVICQNGTWAGQEAEDACVAIMKKPRYALYIDLDQGPETYWLMTTDLNHDYVSLNIDYRS